MSLEAGAKAYISRDTCEKTLSRTLTSVINGEVYIERELMHSLFQTGAQTEQELSPREIDVLRMLCKGMSLTEIARQLHLSNKPSAPINCARWKNWGKQRLSALLPAGENANVRYCYST